MTELPAVYHTANGGRSNARKVDADGYTFDSIAEYRRWLELKLLAEAGSITELKVHQWYELQAAFTPHNGKHERAINYECDFEYTEDGKWIVEDVKGEETDVWKLKRKIFLYQFPTAVLRVTPASRYRR